jgi:DNA-binding MarR family transcriptional regulator
VGHAAAPVLALPALERVVVASVAVTARALAEVAPELTFVQWRVLAVLDSDDGEPVGKVAHALDAKVAAVSRLLSRMRRRGFVETRRDAADARVVRVTLTETGRALRERVVDRRRTDLAAAVRAGLPSDAMVTLDRVATALGG